MITSLVKGKKMADPSPNYRGGPIYKKGGVCFSRTLGADI